MWQYIFYGFLKKRLLFFFSGNHCHFIDYSICFIISRRSMFVHESSSLFLYNFFFMKTNFGLDNCSSKGIWTPGQTCICIRAKPRHRWKNNFLAFCIFFSSNKSFTLKDYQIRHLLWWYHLVLFPKSMGRKQKKISPKPDRNFNKVD